MRNSNAAHEGMPSTPERKGNEKKREIKDMRKKKNENER
jgi:hypothetical protein